MIRELHFPEFDLFKRNDGIVVLTSSDSAWITIREAKKFVSAMHEITEGVPHLLLFIPGRHASIDKEARTFMASAEAWKDTIARATIRSSRAHEIIGDLHAAFDHPVKPVAHFENIPDAIAWLRNQV